MLSKSIASALNDQVNAELFSAYLYLDMSSQADRMGFKGIANWLYVQFQEEMAHGLHIRQYILERGAEATYTDIKAPTGPYQSFLPLFEKVLEHEQYVTARINKIASLAMAEGDHATYSFIGWYVDEQVEEEASADDIVQRLKHMGENAALLYNMDKEMAARVYIDPFATSAKA